MRNEIFSICIILFTSSWLFGLEELKNLSIEDIIKSKKDKESHLVKEVKFDINNPDVVVRTAGQRYDIWEHSDYGPIIRPVGGDVVYVLTKEEFDKLLSGKKK